MPTSIGSWVRMPRMSGNCCAISIRNTLSPTSVCLAKPSRASRSMSSGAKRVLGLREAAVLLDARDLAVGGAAIRVLRRHVAALAGLRPGAGTQGQRPVGAVARPIGAERPLGIGRLLVGVGDDSPLLHHRQMHGVAGAAELRARHVGAVRRRDAERVAHRQHLGCLERAEQPVGRAGEEAAGEAAGEALGGRVEEVLPLGDAGILAAGPGPPHWPPRPAPCGGRRCRRRRRAPACRSSHGRPTGCRPAKARH